MVAAPSVNRAVVQAVKVAAAMSDEVDLVHVTTDPEEGEAFRERAERQIPGVRVVIVESPYRIARQALRALRRGRRRRGPGAGHDRAASRSTCRVHWWDRVLYNQNTHRIRAALVGRREIVVLDAPYRRDE